LAPLWSVASLAYGGIVRLRNRSYDRPSAVKRASIPVLSVGNLTVGGTGKTPLVAWLARRLQEIGRQPAIVSRGYGGRAGRGPLIVSGGSGPRCPVVECGDEPYMLARSLNGTIVVVGSDRPAGADAAAAAGADVVLLDDGFQHRRLFRDMDIVLLDRDAPFGNGRLLPGGALREPLDALGRADVIVVTRCEADDPLGEVEKGVRRHNSDAPILRAGHRGVGFVDQSGLAAAPPSRAAAFCGIGNPARFRHDLEASGIEVVEFRTYRDHHRYTPADIASLERLAGDRGCDLVTTEKDLVRLGPDRFSKGAPLLLASRIEAVVHDAAPLIAALDRTLRSGSR
jgi:tetraacyldisaccharide 4'-kinase